MSVTRLRQTQKLRQIRLARCRREQVITAHNLLNPHKCIVHHRGQVIGVGAVIAHQHKIIHQADVGAVKIILHRVARALGTQTQSRWTLDAALLPLRLAQLTAGTRVCARRTVRGARRLLNFAAGTEALIDEVCLAQLRNRLLIGGKARALIQYARFLALGAFAALNMLCRGAGACIPIQTQCRQISNLTLRSTRAHAIQILHAQVEGLGAAARHRPRQNSGTQITQMQIPRGGGGVASGTAGERRV